MNIFLMITIIGRLRRFYIKEVRYESGIKEAV